MPFIVTKNGEPMGSFREWDMARRFIRKQTKPKVKRRGARVRAIPHIADNWEIVKEARVPSGCAANEMRLKQLRQSEESECPTK